MDDKEREIRERQIKTLEKEIEVIQHQWDAELNDENRQKLQCRIEQKLSQLRTLNGIFKKEEKEKKNITTTSKQNPKNHVRIIYYYVLIVASVGGIIDLWLKNQPSSVTQLPTSSPSIPEQSPPPKTSTSPSPSITPLPQPFVTQLITPSPNIPEQSPPPKTSINPLPPSYNTKTTEYYMTAQDYYNQAMSMSNNQESIAAYDAAIRLNPKYAAAFNSRGLAKFNIGKNKEALDDFTNSIALGNTAMHQPYSNRGFVWHNLGKLDEALSDFNESLRLNPNYPFAYYGRGHVYKDKGYKDQALADLRKAAELYQKYGNTEWYNNSLYSIKELGG